MDDLKLEQTAQSESAVMRDTLETHLPAKVVQADGLTFVDHAKGRDVKDVTPDVMAAKRQREGMFPVRRKGTARLGTLDSLIEWVNRFKGENSALFLDITYPATNSVSDFIAQGQSVTDAQGNSARAKQIKSQTVETETAGSITLTAVMDYHLAGADVVNIGSKICDSDKGLARHAQHRAVYDFPLSQEWQRWLSAAGKSMEVAEFGRFIEDNARNLMDPTPYLRGGVSESSEDPMEWEKDAAETAARLGGDFASVQKMIDMGRSFNVNVEAKAKVEHERQSGRSNIVFTEEHTNDAGESLRLPRLFLIALPVFERGDVFPIICTFGYTKRGGVTLHFNLYDAETAFRDAVTEAANKAEKETALTLFYGVPETA